MAFYIFKMMQLFKTLLKNCSIRSQFTKLAFEMKIVYQLDDLTVLILKSAIYL